MSDVSVDIEIAAPADRVYDLVADLPGMGRWSPECERVEWVGGATSPVVGARFTGHNRNGGRRWSTSGEVAVAERGHEFAFEVTSVMGLPVSRWIYTFAALDGARCRVVESTVDRRGVLIRTLGRLATGVADRTAHNRRTMQQTLDALRRAAEGEVPAR